MAPEVDQRYVDAVDAVEELLYPAAPIRLDDPSREAAWAAFGN